MLGRSAISGAIDDASRLGGGSTVVRAISREEPIAVRLMPPPPRPPRARKTGEDSRQRP